MATETVSHESIAAAKAHQAAEREKVRAATGLRILDSGAIAPPLYIIHCPRCRFAATARTEGQAIRALSAHIVSAHVKEAA